MVELNRAAAVGMADGPAAGLGAIDALRPRAGGLYGSHLLRATRADLLDRAGRAQEALEDYRRARELAPAGNRAAVLGRRIAELERAAAAAAARGHR